MREGWEIKRLEDVCNMYQPKTISKKMLLPDGEYPVFGANGVIGRYNEFNHVEPQLLVTCRGATCGSVNISQPHSWINGNAMVIRPNVDNLIIDYLKYFFKGGINFSAVITGSAQPQITRQSLNPLIVPIPPLNEQKEIVSILDDAFASIDKAKANIERNIENAKELFQSKLNEIFSQTGEAWDKKTLGELGKVCMCKRIMKHQTSPDGDIPFYKIGTFGKSPNAFIDNETYISFKEKYSFPKVGDILISASGTIGRRVIYDGEPAYFQDSNIVWIDNNEDLVSNDYLYYFYGVCNWNPSKGATISRLYNADLRRIEISFPNIETQKLLVEKMVALQKNFEAIQLSYELKLKNLTELKKSILQKAFSGELTNKSVAA